MLEKSEIKYILMAIGFALIWYLWLIPKVFVNFSGQMQFLIVGVGFLILLYFIFKAISLEKSFSIREVLGGLSLMLAFSIWSVPLMVGFNGELLQGPLIYKGAIDYNVALLWASAGISGNLLYILTYVVSLIILLIIGSLLLKNAIRSLG